MRLGPGFYKQLVKATLWAVTGRNRASLGLLGQVRESGLVATRDCGIHDGMGLSFVAYLLRLGHVLGKYWVVFSQTWISNIYLCILLFRKYCCCCYLCLVIWLFFFLSLGLLIYMSF